MAKQKPSHHSSAPKKQPSNNLIALLFLLLGVILPIAGCVWVVVFSERVDPTGSFPASGSLIFLTIWFCLVGILWAIGRGIEQITKLYLYNVVMFTLGLIASGIWLSVLAFGVIGVLFAIVFFSGALIIWQIITDAIAVYSNKKPIGKMTILKIAYLIGFFPDGYSHPLLSGIPSEADYKET